MGVGYDFTDLQARRMSEVQDLKSPICNLESDDEMCRVARKCLAEESGDDVLIAPMQLDSRVRNEKRNFA